MDAVSTRSDKLMPPYSKARNGAGRRINALGKVFIRKPETEKNRTAGDECCGRVRMNRTHGRVLDSWRRLIPKPETEKTEQKVMNVAGEPA